MCLWYAVGGVWRVLRYFTICMVKFDMREWRVVGSAVVALRDGGCGSGVEWCGVGWCEVEWSGAE